MFSIKVPAQKALPRDCKTIKKLFGTELARLTSSEGHAYGEPTVGALWKIWQCIKKEVGVTENDTVGDWGYCY